MTIFQRQDTFALQDSCAYQMLDTSQDQDLSKYNSSSVCEVVPKTAGRIGAQLAFAGKLLRAQSSEKDLLT